MFDAVDSKAVGEKSSLNSDESFTAEEDLLKESPRLRAAGLEGADVVRRGREARSGEAEVARSRSR